jgi:hypothetical protein
VGIFLYKDLHAPAADLGAMMVEMNINVKPRDLHNLRVD